MLRRRHPKKRTQEQIDKIIERIHKQNLYKRRSKSALKKDEIFWCEYIKLCKKYRRYVGGLSAETSIVTVKKVWMIREKLDGTIPYPYNDWERSSK